MLTLLPSKAVPMMTSDKVIAVFGSSRLESHDPEYERIRELGRQLARKGFVICNGGYGGAMEASSRGAKEEGGRTIGVTIAGTACNEWTDREEKQDSWKERLFTLINMAHGYVLCRGGTGTLVEFSCIWEMMQKRIIPPKPAVIFDVYWEKVMEILKNSPEIKNTSYFYHESDPVKVSQVFVEKLM
uniref:Putative Rossmann fold nucleotide-binding protein n=1 Tax=uncultured bacterium W4-21b TaxID=1130993 RepID=H9BWN8_9BACT|nr:putative Rossmann fold nucleotide-binding protein [uncultured bacterium W4-21b]